MRKESFGWISRESIVGSAVIIGEMKGSDILNFGLIGSLLYSAYFMYASPIDRETCIFEIYNAKSLARSMLTVLDLILLPQLAQMKLHSNSTTYTQYETSEITR